jgi:uncharacterized protein (TIGR02099 family)
MKQTILKFLYYIGIVIGIFFILIILGFYALQFITAPYLQYYRHGLEKLDSDLIHYPVKLGAIVIGRSGIDPEFNFQNAVVYDKSGTHEIAKFDELTVHVNLIKSILKRRMEHDLFVSGAQFDLYQDKDFSFSSANKISEKIENILSWLFLSRHINLQNIHLTWHTTDGKEIICPDLKLQIKNELSQHQIVGAGNLTQQDVTQFKFIINIDGDNLQSKELTANGYISFIEKAKADVNLWFNYEQSTLRKLQSQFVINDIILHPNFIKQKIYINHLAGNILLQHKKNIWSLDGNYKDLKVNFGKLFNDSIEFDKLQGVIDWQHSDNDWQIWASNLAAQNNDLDFNADAHLLLPPDSNKQIANVIVDYNLKNVAHASNYYPLKLMPEELIDWLNHSIVDGKNISGKIILHGPLTKFPFNQHDGQFLFSSVMHDMQLKFNPNWPAISHINANMQFDGRTVKIDGDGKTLDIPLQNMHLTIPNVQQPELNVSGDINSNNTNIMNFIYNSPLKKTIAEYSPSAQAFGPVSFRLAIPSLNTKTTHINGVLIEQKGSLKIPDWGMNLADIEGKILFSENSVHANDITASLFNGPIKINVATDITESSPNGPIEINGVNSESNNIEKYPVTLINANGQASIEAIQNQFHLPLLKRTSGKFDYIATLHLYNNKNHVDNFKFLSNLHDIKIDLPDPFFKPENQVRDLYIKAEFDIEKFIYMTLRCGENMSAALNFTKINQNLKFISGALYFGSGLATFQNRPGLLISGYLPEIVWSDWQPYLTKQIAGGESTIRKIDINTDKLQFYGQVLPNTKLQVMPEAKFWQVELHNANVDGHLSIPYDFPQQALEAKFDKLYLTYDKNKIHSLQPTDIPPMNLVSNDFRYGEKKFGHVELNTIPTPHRNSVRINKLVIDSPAYNLSSTGEWEITNGKQYSVLYGTLQTNNAGILLKEWDKTDSLFGGNGDAIFTLRWPGSIYEPDFKTMNGNITLHFKQGRITNLNEATEKQINTGRILNILSLQSLPRRLSLNFDDLTKKGFSFDEMNGNFKLIQGAMYTYDTSLKGIVADILAQGRIGLIKRDCDLLLTMIPHVTSSLPVLATLIGGPVAGVITLAGDELFKHTLQPSIAYLYKVTGSWENPNVIKLNDQNKTALK